MTSPILNLLNYESLKRIIDISLSILILIIISPLILLCAFMIKNNDGGPIFFKQIRVGKNGKKFNLYKFRSMKLDTQGFGDGNYSNDKLVKNIYKTTFKGDPRITNFGKYIRAFHIDEIPQFINVLKGEMSIVGPRPEVPILLADMLEEDFIERHSVLPGITGLAQVSKINNISDTHYFNSLYINKKSIFMDLKIILRTIIKIFVNQSY